MSLVSKYGLGDYLNKDISHKIHHKPSGWRNNTYRDPDEYKLYKKGALKPKRLQKKEGGKDTFKKATWIKKTVSKRVKKNTVSCEPRTDRQMKKKNGVYMYKCFKKGDVRPNYMGSKAGTVFQRKTWVLKQEFRNVTKTTNKKTKTKEQKLKANTAARKRRAKKNIEQALVTSRESGALGAWNKRRANKSTAGAYVPSYMR